MAALVLVTMGSESPLVRRFPRQVRALDMYDLPTADLSDVRGLLLGMHCDQRLLARLQPRLTDFVQRGGRVAACGQVARPFLPGLARFVPLHSYRLADLVVYRLAAHPVWEGVALDELTYRRGVAGFYGRGHHPPPEGALVVNGLGAARLPLDFIYPLGQGRVLFHGGNDLWGYASEATTASRLTPQLLAWLEQA